MVDLLENKQLRRYTRNVLLSQKRYIEADKPFDEDSLRDLVNSVAYETMRGWYVHDSIDLETFEALLNYKFGLET